MNPGIRRRMNAGMDGEAAAAAERRDAAADKARATYEAKWR